MEIVLELDCGLDVEFTPEWEGNNSDHPKVLWCLQHGSDQELVDGMLERNLKNRPIFTDPNTILRLQR